MLSFIMILFLAGDAQAQTPDTPSKKINTSLYEQEPEPEKEKTKSFSAKVKVVREESDGVEVFFEGEKNKGAYMLMRSTEHYAKMLKDLEASRKPKGTAVSVTVDADKRIKTVEKSKAPQQPTDPNQPWDFGKIPD
ncbi:hypothetical protein [Bdellovibrio bacteriovorus]|uniref:hypothetical protein n=1 Tax=Bdellovibrio TaxID=958 RepID=UPI0035A95008